MSKKKVPEAAHAENHERWIVSYADMLTLLFALFVVLYATSDANPQKLQSVHNSIEQAFSIGVLQGSNGSSAVLNNGGGITPSINEIKSNNLVALEASLGGFAEANNLEGKIQIRSDADSITISLADNLLFDSGSADLRAGSQDVLMQVAGALKGLPNEMRIEGHTDNVPVNSADFATNWELSAARASRVLRFMREQGGLTANSLFLAGYADTRPFADNSTPEGRALNRRADIVILYPTLEDLSKSLQGVKGN
ncbi:MAG: flagellar motor protein MotB [Dehalococcoidia bacterium]|jgi:chemotaxis protein MotB|uniref:OmpA/MotB family protein n=1 Tax=Candidatus Amarobacter glycogenicus TaxID=3140699 RepID=UPI003134E66A|nr:flagellar motor protein MotB [Dehalococcoidia bacterium]MBK6560321.1 flagellar motor protein MotB [Dehalococcoidia bacterium]MBK7328424.1 flagellar motor protein MotB [Dehalococcoidia bacterium]